MPFFAPASFASPSREFPRIPSWGWWGARASRLGILCLLLTAFSSDAAPPRTAPEPELKAAAIANIIAFVEWRPETFATADSPLVVGVLGDGPVAAVLGDFIAGSTWNGRKVTLERYTQPGQIRGCHVLFLAPSEQARWPAVRPLVRGRSILTVSEADNFARKGGIMQLATANSRLRLTINHGVARANGLVISSKVLRLAEVIDDRAP